MEILRPEVSFRVYFGGYKRHHTNADGRFAVQWIRERQVKEAARDMPIQGFRVNSCNVLRLWKAKLSNRSTSKASILSELRDALDQIGSGRFSRRDTTMFRPLLDSLLHSDPFLVLANFAEYPACQERVSETWRDKRQWTRMSIWNMACSGKISLDRAITEYCERIWMRVH